MRLERFIRGVGGDGDGRCVGGMTLTMFLVCLVGLLWRNMIVFGCEGTRWIRAWWRSLKGGCSRCLALSRWHNLYVMLTPAESETVPNRNLLQS